MVSSSKGRRRAPPAKSQLVTTIRSSQATPLADKMRGLLKLQQAQFPSLSRERTLKSWEKPWDVEP